MQPRDISIHNFDYSLPEDRIASHPLPNRDDAKLLIYRKGAISETVFKRLANELPKGSFLVFNNSKVIEARLLFQKPTGGVIEIFALEPDECYPDITVAMQAQGEIFYKCLIGGAGKWKHGMILEKKGNCNGQELRLTASIVERRPDCFLVNLQWTPGILTFAEVLHGLGQIPIPPYLHRQAETSDAERYQTVYARHDGSVAAPTAGLHFTSSVLESLIKADIREAYVTLHVGAGTFMPVKSDTMEGHAMHAEFIDVSLAFLEELAGQSLVVPVGTTSMRTLESLYWMGVKAYYKPEAKADWLEMQQWEVYDTWATQTIEATEALKALISWMQERQMTRLIIKTSILIMPGYTFRICKGIITNFHQPQSTLLLLVSALVGDDWKRIYQYALDHDFRFLSYGDSSLLLP